MTGNELGKAVTKAVVHRVMRHALDAYIIKYASTRAVTPAKYKSIYEIGMHTQWIPPPGVTVLRLTGLVLIRVIQEHTTRSNTNGTSSTS